MNDSRTRSRNLLAVALLAAGLVLTFHAIRSALRIETIDPPPAVLPITESAEVAARRRDNAGRYATGSQPGDRVIVVSTDGKIAFTQLGAKQDFATNHDTFTLARREKKICLVTAASGVVDFVNSDTLLYYGDTYRRTR
jgi:hypothetical protein